jgi:hypothetical protein
VELRELPQLNEINILERQTDTNRSVVFQRLPGRLANLAAFRSGRFNGHATCAAPVFRGRIS